MKRTQTDRVIEFIQDHPAATSWEITVATGTVNVTGRISDARAAGVDIVCERREDGRQGYRVREPHTQQVPLFRWDEP
jgi:hypothetical protein